MLFIRLVMFMSLHPNSLRQRFSTLSKPLAKAGGLAKQGSDGGQWRLEEIEGRIKSIVLSRNSNEETEQTEKSDSKKFFVLSGNSDEGFGKTKQKNYCNPNSP